MDSEKKINGHTYYDPHKWIICLLGSDMFMVNNFMQQNEIQLKSSLNLSISIMAMSNEVLQDENVKEYIQLCNLTKEGIYVNIIDKGIKAD